MISTFSNVKDDLGRLFYCLYQIRLFQFVTEFPIIHTNTNAGNDCYSSVLFTAPVKYS